MGGIGVSSLVAHAVRQVRAEGRFGDGIAVIDCTGQRDGHELLRVALARFDAERRQPEALDLVGMRQAAETLLGGKDALVVLEGVEPGLALAEITRPLLAAGATVVLTAHGYLGHVPHDATLLLGTPPIEEALALFTRVYEQAGSGPAVEPKPALAERIVNALARHPLALTLVATNAAEEQRVLSAVADALQGDPRGGLGLEMDDVRAAAALGLEAAIGRLGDATLRLFTAFGAFGTREVGREALMVLAEAFAVERPGEQLRRLTRRGLVYEWTDERLPHGGDRERLRLHPLVYALAAQHFATLAEGEQGTIEFVLMNHYANVHRRGGRRRDRTRRGEYSGGAGVGAPQCADGARGDDLRPHAVVLARSATVARGVAVPAVGRGGGGGARADDGRLCGSAARGGRGV